MLSPSSPSEDRVRAAIGRDGPLEAFRQLIAANDALILGADLDNGREIAANRTAIYRGLMAHWAAEKQEALGYDGAFAVVALGGTGRDEMTPCSDTDFAFLFDDVIEGNAFLMELQRQSLHTGEFRKRCGFAGETQPFNLDDMPNLEGKQLNAFVDMRPVYDPDGLAPRFRERIRATYDPFEHFLHVSRSWRDHWGESIAESERLDRFDIKSDGLRIFLAGIWSLAGKEFRHSHAIYGELEDRRDLDAYDFLLRIRAFIHLRRGTRRQPSATGNHPEDILSFDDFTAFGDILGPEASERERFEFANEVRERLLSARRRVDRFTWGAIGRELKQGRSIRSGSAIVYGTGGLRDAAAADRKSDRERSRAALAVLLASQRYELPVDPSEMETTFRNAGDWLIPVPELSALFYETRGSLANSLEFLSQLPGAQERLFPGYAKFESSLDTRVITERKSLRGALLRQKIHALENDWREGRRQLYEARNPQELTDADYETSIPVEAALLDADHLAAVKLALKTKRLPETAEDLAARSDATLPLHERFSSGLSGIPLEHYYTRSFAPCEFTAATLEIARFLVVHRRLFKERADQDLMDARQVKELIAQCGNDEARLRALFVFTCADRTEWESEARDPARWFNIRELYAKARMEFHPDFDPTRKVATVGYSPEELEILNDFGRDFFEGIYRHYAIRFGGYLLRLAAAAADSNSTALPPRVDRIRIGTSEILAAAARDHPGIAASISGAFWKHGVELRQAHLFSATNHGLALDFFHLAPVPPEAEPQPGAVADLARAIVEAIEQNLYISEEDEAGLPGIAENVTLEQTASGLYHLRAETARDVGALIYVMTCKAYRCLGANIHGLAAHTGRNHAWVSVYLNLPETMSLNKAREIIGDWE